MTDRLSASGRCICGAVTVTAERLSTHLTACHCDTCRRWNGAPWFGVDAGTAVSFSGGEEQITIYDSSAWAERGFCRSCGTHLFYRLKKTGQHLLAAGLFDNVPFAFVRQVFVDERPDYYAFANETETMTAAEVFAKYGG